MIGSQIFENVTNRLIFLPFLKIDYDLSLSSLIYIGI